MFKIMEEFIKNFYDVFDETDIEELKPETRFRDLEEWSSLHALATMNMIEQFYGKKVPAEQMKAMNTIQELYNFAHS